MNTPVVDTCTSKDELAHASSTLIRVVETTWVTIQANNPDVPPVFVTIGEGGNTLGHFWANRWKHRTEDHKIHELFLGGEGLERGGSAVMGITFWWQTTITNLYADPGNRLYDHLRKQERKEA